MKVSCQLIPCLSTPSTVTEILVSQHRSRLIAVCSTSFRSLQRLCFHWIGLTTWIWLWLAFPAQAVVLMRVGVAIDVPKITLGSSTDARILDSQGTPVAQIEGMKALPATRIGQGVQLGSATGNRLYLQPQNPDGLVFIGKYWYRGLVELIPSKSGLIVVNQVGLEDYVSSVVGSEMGHRFPTEALRAQAVAARTYALFHRNLRLRSPFDLGDEQDWQVYKGVSSESNLTQAAARDTIGQVVTYQGQLINAVFHASSGGHTDNSENVWTSSTPYLQGVPDFDVAAPVFSWSTTLSAQQLQQAVSGIGTIQQLEVVRKSPWGRAVTVRVTGSDGNKEISAEEFRMMMDLRSSMFTITPRVDPVIIANASNANSGTASPSPSPSPPPSFQINGRGFGHGLGMSQWGAVGLANKGTNYKRILSYYYKGTALALVQKP